MHGIRYNHLDKVLVYREVEGKVIPRLLSQAKDRLRFKLEQNKRMAKDLNTNLYSDYKK